MKQLNNALDPGILAHAQKLERLTMLLRNELPPECDGHYHAAAIHDNTLVIVTDSPVWTTRLRQLGPKILQLLKDKTPRVFSMFVSLADRDLLSAITNPLLLNAN